MSVNGGRGPRYFSASCWLTGISSLYKKCKKRQKVTKFHNLFMNGKFEPVLSSISHVLSCEGRTNPPSMCSFHEGSPNELSPAIMKNVIRRIREAIFNVPIVNLVLL